MPDTPTTFPTTGNVLVTSTFLATPNNEINPIISSIGWNSLNPLKLTGAVARFKATMPIPDEVRAYVRVPPHVDTVSNTVSYMGFMAADVADSDIAALVAMPGVFTARIYPWARTEPGQATTSIAGLTDSIALATFNLYWDTDYPKVAGSDNGKTIVLDLHDELVSGIALAKALSEDHFGVALAIGDMDGTDVRDSWVGSSFVEFGFILRYPSSIVLSAVVGDPAWVSTP